MEIVVTHLTRMAKGYCCAAGIEISTGKSIRAVQRPYGGSDSRLTTEWLWLFGGPFKVGNVIDLGETHPVPNPPETEDHWVNPANVRIKGSYSPIQFWSMLRTYCKPNLGQLLGVEPIHRRASILLKSGTGTSSLGLYHLIKSPKISISKGLNESKIRLTCMLDETWANLSVTDTRLYCKDCLTPDELKIEQLSKSLARDAKAGRLILGLGLTRPFAESEGGEAVHWLQVTGLHFPNSM